MQTPLAGPTFPARQPTAATDVGSVRYISNRIRPAA